MLKAESHTLQFSSRQRTDANTAMKKRTIAFALLFIGCSAIAHAQRPDFSGVWQLDRDASEINTADALAGLGDPAPPNLYITQQRNGAVILSSRINGSEPRAYRMGGQTWVQAPPPEDGRVLIRSRIRGLSMISEGTGEVDGEIVQVSEVMRMGSRGDVLTIEATTTRSSGPETNKLVYRRAGGR